MANGSTNRPSSGRRAGPLDMCEVNYLTHYRKFPSVTVRSSTLESKDHPARCRVDNAVPTNDLKHTGGFP